MLSVPDVVSDTLAAITERLAARHDGLTILRAVTDACTALLSADATGVLVADPRGGVEVAAASDERARFVELLQAQTEEGPCLDCITGNRVVISADVDGDRDRWPRFAPAMAEAGFHSVHAFPLRLVDRAIGGLNLFRTARTALPAADLRLAQALADLATLGLTQERDERRVQRLAEQTLTTLTTLNDRALVGHAVGMIAATLGTSSDDARRRLSAYGAMTGRSLRDLARAVTDRTLAPESLDDVAGR